MSELQNSAMEMKQEQADYRDTEGYLCCGKCKTRKETKIPWLSFDGTGRKSERMVPTPCKCAQERRDQEEAERKERDRQMTASRFRSVCFTSAKRREQTFENATMISQDLLDKAKRFVDEWPRIKAESIGLLF